MKCIWQLEHSSKNLYQGLINEFPWLEKEIEKMLVAPPTVETCLPFENETTIRPPLHNRAYYIKCPDNTCIAIKGTEIFANDFIQVVTSGSQRRALISGLPLLEHFTVFERKAPFVVLKDEALLEANKSSAVQTAHYKTYRKLARLPIPIFVFQISEIKTTQYLNDIKNLLSASSRTELMKITEPGLAVFVYFYPGNQLRVRDLTFKLQNTNNINGFFERRSKVLEFCNPSDLIINWVRLLVRLLHLGYFPANRGNSLIGQSVQAQNLVIDGGFVDCDSFQNFSDVSGTQEFYESLMLSVGWLGFSVQELLMGLNQFPAFMRSPVLRAFETNFLSSYITSTIWAALEDEVRSEVNNGRVFDQRILDCFTIGTRFDRLNCILDSIFPPEQTGQRIKI
jgi:hypothetical protein